MSHNLHFARSLYEGYENYKEVKLKGRRFKHSDITALIEKIKHSKLFRVDKAGESVQGRDLFLISIGSGKTKIFCWSQMHGDEPTATAAIFDIFNFFLAESHYREFKEVLLHKVTLCFMPMVNPDGAELFQRRNVHQIDLNRDAVRLQSPESRVLFSVYNKIKPEFCFNLHDQDRTNAVGKTGNPASISFLAPPFDVDNSLNEKRTHAMSLIGEQFNILSQFIPGHIGRYSNEYEHRAFGDTFARSGSSVILVESGAWRGDREKEFLRKINFVSLLSAFKCIAEESYLAEPIEIYDTIPLNEDLMMDFIIRNVSVNRGGNDYRIDIGINYDEINIDEYNHFYYRAIVKDIGDLSVFSGYEEFDAGGMSLEMGKTYSTVYNSLDEIKSIKVEDLLGEGITNLILKSPLPDYEFSNLIFNIIIHGTQRVEELAIDKIPNFVLKEKDTIKYYIINGFLTDIKNTGRKKGNALVFK